jgi:hypothetical protein
MSVADDVRAIILDPEYNHGTLVTQYQYLVGTYSETAGQSGSLPTYNGVAAGFTDGFPNPGQPQNGIVHNDGQFGDGPYVFQVHGTSVDGNTLFYTLAGMDSAGNAYNTLYAFSNVPLGPTDAVAYSSDNAVFYPSGHAPLCVAEGTLIATPVGETPVEELQPGDLIKTASGISMVQWVGKQSFRCDRHPRHDDVIPIAVAVNAFGRGQPHSKLRLSAGHAVAVSCFDEILVPISGLVNGATIKREPVSSVTYWHVELDRHDLLIANGLTVESYLDVGNRAGFHEGLGVSPIRPELTADQSRGDGSCRPRILSETIHNALRSRLRARAEDLGWRLVPTPPRMDLLIDEIRHSPIVVAEGRIRFKLGRSARTIRLLSNTFVPRFIWDGNSDGRHLGLMITSISVHDGDMTVEVPLGSRALDRGFYAHEASASPPHRWTDGNAVFSAPLLRGTAEACEIEIAFAANPALQWQPPEFEEVSLARSA